MTRRWLALVLPLALGACGYNRIQSLDEQANSAQGQIEVQLQRRAELIPNLVATVKGLANQELAVFGEVARARRSAQRRTDQGPRADGAGERAGHRRAREVARGR
jgi:LemA protein